MQITRNEIIDICLKNVPSFADIIKNIKYENKGIFNSEMLLVISLFKYFNLNLMIESGRSKGYSTQLLAESLKSPKIRIFSVEYEKYNSNVIISYEKLKKYKNLHLLFGNSFKIVPKIITDQCFVLIDGPKGMKSIELAVEILKNPLVKGVFIHDMHQNTPYRFFAEELFKNPFFTDEEKYVNKFKCWRYYLEHKKKINSQVREYYFGKSYSETLLFVQNGKDSINYEYYLKYISKKQYNSQKLRNNNLFKCIIETIKRTIKFPKYFFFYEKVILKKESINLLYDLKLFVNLVKVRLFQSIK